MYIPHSKNSWGDLNNMARLVVMVVFEISVWGVDCDGIFRNKKIHFTFSTGFCSQLVNENPEHRIFDHKTEFIENHHVTEKTFRPNKKLTFINLVLFQSK